MKTQDYANDYAKFYENLTQTTPQSEYALFFDKSSTFKDPFQEVQGLKAIHNIFVDMYDSLHNPRFLVDEVIVQNSVAYIRWDFSYARDATKPYDSFSGISRVEFSQSGKVKSHIDYWDAAEHVYEKIPLLGSIIRFIKKRIHA